MMKRYCIIFSLMLLCLSCAREIQPLPRPDPENPQHRPMTFVYDGYVAGPVSVFDVTGENREFRIADGAAEPSVSGVATESETYKFVYPYNESYIFEYTGIPVSVEPVQEAFVDAFDSTSVFAAGLTSGSDVDMRLLNTFVSFEIETEDITSVVLRGGNGEKLSGAVNVCFGNETHFSDIFGINDADSVRIENKDGLALKPGKYSFVAIPGYFGKGIELTFSRLRDERVARKVVETPVAALAGGEYKFGKIDTDALRWRKRGALNKLEIPLVFGDEGLDQTTYYDGWYSLWGLETSYAKTSKGPDEKKYTLSGTEYSFTLWSSVGYGYRKASNKFYGLCLAYTNVTGLSNYNGWILLPTYEGLALQEVDVRIQGASNYDVSIASSVDPQTGVPQTSLATKTVTSSAAKDYILSFDGEADVRYYLCTGTGSLTKTSAVGRIATFESITLKYE